jgi:hypothetical protein
VDGTPVARDAEIPIVLPLDLDRPGGQPTEPELGRRKKRKKKRPEYTGSGLSSHTMRTFVLAGILTFLWMGLTVWAFLMPVLVIRFIMLGGLAIGIGTTFLLRAASDESPLAVLCCIFVPFYPVFFLITHLEEAAQPFMTRLFGIMVVLSAILAYQVRIDLKHHAKEPQPVPMFQEMGAPQQPDVGDDPNDPND